MSDKTWKQTERAIAHRLGGVRVGNRGQATPDVVNDWLCVEVKTRKELPDWLENAMYQAEMNAGVSQLPLVILHETGQRHDADLVLIRLRDFCDWFGSCDLERVSDDERGQATPQG